MGFWGWVWWGGSRSQLVKTNQNMPKPLIHTSHGRPQTRLIVTRVPTCGSAPWPRPMPLAEALQLVLGHYDIYDVDTLVAILRSPHDASQVADLIDGSRALIDATAGTAHVSVQAEPTTATVGMATEHGVATRDVASMATFSTTGARLVSSQVQCNVRMVQREVQATRVVRDASASATIKTADASTCHYLVVGIGLAHGSTQTEPEPELPHQPEPPKAKPHGRCEWREPRRASPIHQLQTEQPPDPGWEGPPPVFARIYTHNDDLKARVSQ